MRTPVVTGVGHIGEEHLWLKIRASILSIEPIFLMMGGAALWVAWGAALLAPNR